MVAAISTRLFPKLRPSPVFVTTPTIIPAQAQATATLSAVLAPSVNAVMNLLKLIRVSFINALTMIVRSEEHTSELQSRFDLVCRLLLEKKKKNKRCKYNEHW